MADASSRSLWNDAWRRLRKNRFAMIGLAIVVVVCLAAIFAPAISPFEPDYGQPWLRAQPPGFRHPAVIAEIRFDRGAPATVPVGVPDRCREIMTSDGVLEYLVYEVADELYRVKMRRGKVDEIQRMTGAQKVPELVVEGGLPFLQLDGDPGAPELHDIRLARGEALPAGLPQDRPVLMVRVRAPATSASEPVRVEIKDGTVAAIRRGETELEALRIEGRHVVETKKDGEVQELSHMWGTDLAGRDVFTRVVYGGRISLMVGAIATLVSVLIGVIYGALAGYLAQTPLRAWHVLLTLLAVVAAFVVAWMTELWLLAPVVLLLVLFAFPQFGKHLPRLTGRWLGRRVTTQGEVMMRAVDILDALPFMFLVILLMISFGQDIFTLFLALGAVQWLTIARIVRGQVLSLKEKEFVEAARMSGTGHGGIVMRHLIPNTMGVVVVYATLTIPAVILQESFLAFIGLTVEVQGRTLDSWGSLVNIGRQALGNDGSNAWVLVFPSLAMALTLFSLNFLGDGLRDALDPKLKGRG